MAELKKEKIIIYVLAILLVIAIFYIISSKYQSVKLASFQQGIQIGYQNAVDQLIQQTLTCQPVSLFKENKTISVIAIQCLQQKAPSQAALEDINTTK